MERWLEAWRMGGAPSPDELASELDPESQSALAQIALLDIQFKDERRAVTDALNQFLYLPRLERRLVALRQKLEELRPGEDPEQLWELEAEFQRLCRERLALLRRRG
ncbi:MAG TPA: hypothetical protein ENI38_03010 [Candidatus Acetothermia bacterium]|nr:hypothetical protein [Candidatus Acetothermia bacterium]